MPDNYAEIVKLEALLSSGATSVQVDGQSVTLDHDSIRRRIRELRATDEIEGRSRLRVATINLENLA